MRRGPAHDGDHERRAREAVALERDLLVGRLRIVRLEHRRDGLAGLEPRIAVEHDEAPGRELAMVRHARRDGQQRIELGRGGARAGELDGFYGSSGLQDVDGVRHSRLRTYLRVPCPRSPDKQRERLEFARFPAVNRVMSLRRAAPTPWGRPRVAALVLACALAAASSGAALAQLAPPGFELRAASARLDRAEPEPDAAGQFIWRAGTANAIQSIAACAAAGATRGTSATHGTGCTPARRRPVHSDGAGRTGCPHGEREVRQGDAEH